MHTPIKILSVLVICFLLALASNALHSATATVTAANTAITVNWSSTQQTIDGFGAYIGDDIKPTLTSSVLQTFFSQSSGIGFSIVRLWIYPDYASCVAYSLAANCVAVASGATVTHLEAQNVQIAKGWGATIFFGACWSPPASMKSNGSYTSGGNFIGNSGNYATFAADLAQFPALMATYGIPISGVSPQNEPDVDRGYPSALWTAQQFHDFIPYLHAALSTAGYGSVKIMFPEDSSWSSDYEGYAATAMDDSSVAPDVSLMIQHGYGVTYPSAAPTYGLHTWMTEDSDNVSSGYQGNSISDALIWAQKIHNWLTEVSANAWVWWEIVDGRHAHACAIENLCLIDKNGSIALRAYATGNWSKFVRPGWKRVGLTNNTGLLVTAFVGSPGHAVVVVNTTGSAIETTFGVGTTMGSSVTPWITSATYSLKAQSTVTVLGGVISYRVPASSVVTLVSST